MAALSEPQFMPWLDYLPEVGDPLRNRRADLWGIVQESLAAEARAHALRDELRSGTAELLVAVLGNWTFQQLETAARMAEPLCSPERPATPALQRFLTQAEGLPLATEALLVIEGGQVLSSGVLAGTASESECRQALARVVEWWQHVAAPICSRLQGAVRGQTEPR